MRLTHISVRDMDVRYEGRHALRGVSVDIPDRNITAIIGSSGCGKTTLLKSINRLIELDGSVNVSGQVLIDGEDIYDLKNGETDVNSIRRKIGYIAQTPNPLPMSIYDNVAYGPRINGNGRDKGILDKLVEECLASAGLWKEVKDRLHDPASRLSVGQQQRLCLARALAVRPEVLLCDEPTSSLDPVSAKHIEEQLMVLKNEYTVVFVTHTLRQAKRIADYVIFMHMGELVEHGPADRMFSNPVHEKTKEYISGVFG
jgi:phosphate transport system ATP-binding protein